MAMPGRTYAAPGSLDDKYRYSHNGQEKDNDIFIGALSAEFWEYDSRTGRRWEIDPIVKTWESPYATFSNNPIWNNDVRGLDAKGGPKKRFSTKKRVYKRGQHKDGGKKGDSKGKDNGKGEGKEKGNPEKKQSETKPTEKQKENKQGPTIYIYRVKTYSDNNYRFENDKELSDKHLRDKIAPEIARIMNNNWLNTPINVKVITEEEAKSITSDFLAENKSAIMPIVRARDLKAKGSSLGQSEILTPSGYTNPDPNYTYMNYSGMKTHSETVLGVSSDYGLAYAIAHEAVHQMYSRAQVNFDPLAEHTNGWPNLNRDGNEVGPQDFKSISPFDYLKNKAEWIPMKIKQVINDWLKPKPIKP